MLPPIWGHIQFVTGLPLCHRTSWPVNKLEPKWFIWRSEVVSSWQRLTSPWPSCGVPVAWPHSREKPWQHRALWRQIPTWKGYFKTPVDILQRVCCGAYSSTLTNQHCWQIFISWLILEMSQTIILIDCGFKFRHGISQFVKNQEVGGLA